jgi:hypothetical protein
MKSAQHWSRLIFAGICVVAAGGFLLSDALAKQSRQRTVKTGAALATDVAAQAATLPPANPTYVAGNFTFSTPFALTHAPIQAYSPCPLPTGCPAIKDQDDEPEIKADIWGNVYVTAIHGYPGGVDLWKSTDKGATFSYLGIPDGTQDKCVTGVTPCIGGGGGGDDSIDVSSGGYLYISSLLPSTVTMSVSYDGGIGGAEPGQKWEVNPASSTIPVNDREWVAAYGPQTVYMTFDQAPVNTTIWFTKSTDAGKTWSAPSMLIPLQTLSRENNLGVDQFNGNIYTTYTPTGKPYELHLLKSTDGGGTWANTIIYSAPATNCLENAFPILAVDRGGNIHVVFTQSTGCGPAPGRTNAHVYLISSGDGGSTWTSPLKIDSGSGNNSTVMPYIAAGSPGVVDVTWYGSTMTSPDNAPSAADHSDWWNVYFAQVTNALQANPTIAQSTVATAVHNLPICSRGGNCTGNTRDLTEYYSMTIDPDGNANIAYVDEVNYCAAHPATNCYAHTYYAKQTAGQSAYNPPAGPQGSNFSINISVGTPGGEPGIKIDSHNCIFATAPGGASLWKSVNNGLSFLPKVNPVAGYAVTGGDEDVLPIPKSDGTRPDILYFADLAGLTAINIAESTNGGSTWFKPGPGGAASEMDLSSDRQWLAYDRNVPNAGDLTVYEMDHEAAGEAIRFSALVNDSGPWSPPASGMTAPELILPPGSTFPNTNPGNVFVNKNTHNVIGLFSASTLTNDLAAPPFGKQPNLWAAVGAAPTAAGLPPGPFMNFPAFKGVIDSPAQAPSPAPSIPPSAATYGNHIGLLFPASAIDSAGNVYAVWATNSNRANTVQTGTNTPSTTFDIWMSVSHDGGQNFYGPFRVSNGVGTSLMPNVTAGDAGRVEIVWYQTPNVGPPLVAAAGELQGGPDGVPANSQWNVMFAQSLNADSREPAFTISQASDHPNHNGGICVNGTLCLLGGDRSLADFFQVAIGPDGLANIAYADNGHSSTHTEYTRQTSGPLGLTNPVSTTCIPMVIPVNAVSRKVHGNAGPFDVDLTNGSGIECRSGGASNAHQIVITFAHNISSVGGVTVASGTGTVHDFSVNGTVVTVNLTGVANAQRLVLDLTNVDDGTTVGDAFVAMNVLAGDTNADKFCDSVDTSQTKSQSGHTASNSPPNFREDVNTDGFIDAVDTAFVKSKSGTSLP